MMGKIKDLCTMVLWVSIYTQIVEIGMFQRFHTCTDDITGPTATRILGFSPVSWTSLMAGSGSSQGF